MTRPETHERRKHPRIDCSLPVHLRKMDEDQGQGVAERASKEFITTSRNISEGGLCLTSNTPVKQNELLRVSIDLPGTTSKVTAFAEVIWSSEDYCGIQFLAVHEQQSSLWREFMQTLMYQTN